MPVYTPPKAPVAGIASGALTLTTTSTDVVGMAVALTPGTWLVAGTFNFINAGGDVGSIYTGSIVSAGGAATITGGAAQAVWIASAAGASSNVTQVWSVVVTAATTIKGQAAKNTGAGTSTVGVTHSTLMAFSAGS